MDRKSVFYHLIRCIGRSFQIKKKKSRSEFCEHTENLIKKKKKKHLKTDQKDKFIFKKKKINKTQIPKSNKNKEKHPKIQT